MYTLKTNNMDRVCWQYIVRERTVAFAQNWKWKNDKQARIKVAVIRITFTTSNNLSFDRKIRFIVHVGV